MDSIQITKSFEFFVKGDDVIQRTRKRSAEKQEESDGKQRHEPNKKRLSLRAVLAVVAFKLRETNAWYTS